MISVWIRDSVGLGMYQDFHDGRINGIEKDTSKNLGNLKILLSTIRHTEARKGRNF